MEVWVWILIFTVGITAFLAIVTFLFQLIVYWAAGRYSEKTIRKYTEKLEQALPGTNCGACGCESCRDYALAVFHSEKGTDCCPSGSEELPGQLDALMERFHTLIEEDPPKEKKRWFKRFSRDE